MRLAAAAADDLSTRHKHDEVSTYAKNITKEAKFFRLLNKSLTSCPNHKRKTMNWMHHSSVQLGIQLSVLFLHKIHWSMIL